LEKRSGHGVHENVLALAAFSGGASAQEMDARTTRALNNVQHEKSTSYGYFNLVANCIGDQDPLAQQYKKLADHLIGILHPMGRGIGMTDDAMSSRLLLEIKKMQGVMNNNCINVSSLFGRHATRCKQVVENGDAILDEYLARK
jgi:hypothetical protein